MKYLIALSIIQAAALGFFGLRVMKIDAQSDAIAMTVEANAKKSERGVANTHPATSAAISGPTVEEIRQIFREEIAAFNDQNLTQPGPGAMRSQADNDAGVVSDAAAAADQFHLRGAVVRDIDNYIGLGRIEPSQMADLQMKLARLPPEDRRAMLTRLTKAMNAGDLKGEF